MLFVCNNSETQLGLLVLPKKNHTHEANVSLFQAFFFKTPNAAFFLTTTQPFVLTLNGLIEAVCKKQVDFKSEAAVMSVLVKCDVDGWTVTF